MKTIEELADELDQCYRSSFDDYEQGKCFACKFANVNGLDFYCHRSSPVRVGMSSLAMWPQVKPTDCCGEFSRIESKDEIASRAKKSHIALSFVGPFSSRERIKELNRQINEMESEK